MKLFILFFSLICVSYSFAQLPPQMRVCNAINASFWSYRVKSPVKDEFGFCVLNEKSAIGSLSMMLFLFDGEMTKAVKALKASSWDKYQTCETAGAITISGKDSELENKDLCLFQDLSIVFRETLVLGIKNSVNNNLRLVLEL